MSRSITIQNLMRTPYVVQYTNSLGQRIETPILNDSFATFDMRVVSNSNILNNVLILKINNQDRLIDFGVTTQGVFISSRSGADGLIKKLGDFILVIERGFGSGNPNEKINCNIQLNIDLTVKNKKSKKKIEKLIELLAELSELNSQVK